MPHRGRDSAPSGGGRCRCRKSWCLREDDKVTRGLGDKVTKAKCSSFTFSPCHLVTVSSQSLNHPMRVLISQFHCVLADELTAFAIARGGEGLVMKAASGERHHFDAA